MNRYSLFKSAGIISLFSLIFFVFSCCSIELDEKELESFFDSQINEDFRKKYGISSIGVSITQGSDTVFFKGYGFQNPSKQTLVTNKTIFGLASISKTFIAVSTVKLIPKDDNFYDNVNDHLNEIKVSDVIHGNYYTQFGGRPQIESLRGIEIWNLLTHTAGFDSESSMRYRHQTNTLLEDIQNHLPPRIRQTDLVSTYSNYGAALLALIIEQKNPKKMEYGQYIQKSIFEPLGMKKTFYGYENAKKNDEINLCSTTTFSEDGKYEKVKDFLGDDIGAKPSGIIYSSSEDMQEYAKTLLLQKNKNFFTSKQHKNLFDPLFKPSKNRDVNFSPPKNEIMDTKNKVVHFENSISSFFYTKVIGPEKWIGHDGDLPPFHSQMMLSFQHNISFILLFTAKDSTFRDILRKEFTQHFLYTNETIKEWCTESKINSSFVITNNVYDEENGLCRKTFSLNEDFPRSISEVQPKYVENYVGCYLPFRFVHTSYLSTLFELSSFRRNQYICLELIDDGLYLGIRQEDEKNQFPISIYSNENQQDIIFLENGNHLESKEFIVGQRRGEDIVEIILGDVSPPIVSFVFEEDSLDENSRRGGADNIDNSKKYSDKKYLVMYDIYNTFEFYGSKGDVFWTKFGFILYATLNPVFGGLIICFACFCIIVFGYSVGCCGKLTGYLYGMLMKRKRRGIPLIVAKNSINSHDLYFWKKNIAQEYDMIPDGDKKNNSLSDSVRRKRSRGQSGIVFGGGLKRRNGDDKYDYNDQLFLLQGSTVFDRFFYFMRGCFLELNACCVMQFCILIFSVFVLGSNILHFLFMYVFGGVVWISEDHMMTPIPLIVFVGAYLPLVSIVFLVMLVFVGGGFCIGCNFLVECCCVVGKQEDDYYDWNKNYYNDCCWCCFCWCFRCTSIVYHRWCQYFWLCCCIGMIFGVAVVYYVMAGYYNSFMFVNLVKAN